MYKHEPYGLVFIHDNPLGLRPRVYHLSHQTFAGLYVSCKPCVNFQLTELRTLKLGSDPASGNVITQNWRNIQELNGRVIACYSAAFSLVLSPLLIAASLLYMI